MCQHLDAEVIASEACHARLAVVVLHFAGSFAG